MTVIAMTREMGTLGKDIAAGLADSLGLRVVHHELVEHDLASRMGVQESTVHHYLEGNASLLERWSIDRRKLSRYTAVEILELAQAGNIIIRGWGATALLRDVPHVLRVRVCAPMAFRERTMMKRLGTDDRGMVRREIERSDAAHEQTISGFFGVDWTAPELYHLVLNTQSIPVETCVRALRLLADDQAFVETAETRGSLADKLTEWRVRSTLADGNRSAALNHLDVSARDGYVILTGIATHSQAATLAAQTVRTVPGVRDVETRLVVSPSFSGM